eukprot:PhM_4_TR5617/c0_g1_i1/m.27641
MKIFSFFFFTFFILPVTTNFLQHGPELVCVLRRDTARERNLYADVKGAFLGRHVVDGHALAGQWDHRAVGGHRVARDDDAVPVEVADDLREANKRLEQRDLEGVVQVVALAGEQVVRGGLDAEDHVAWDLPGILVALHLERYLVLLRQTAFDLHVEHLVTAEHTRTLADGALLRDGLALAAARWTLLLHLLDEGTHLHALDYDTLALALLACGHVLLRRGTGAFALAAELLFLNRDGVRVAGVDVLKRHLEVHLKGLAAVDVATMTSAEQRGEGVHVPPLVGLLELLDASLTVHVVHFPFLAVGQDLVGALDLGVAIPSLLRGVMVGVILLAEDTELLLDIPIGTVFALVKLKNSVVVNVVAVGGGHGTRLGNARK